MSNPISQEPDQAMTRYAKVRAILDAASAGSTANYAGYGRFWNLPLQQFLTLELFGVRMIAPADGIGDGISASGATNTAATCGSVSQSTGGCPSKPAPVLEKSCCHAPTEINPAPAAGKIPGRGAASGLIRGLRGEFPFDGSQFSRLPWGGLALAAADINFIEQWIDDGCPENDDAAGKSEAHANLRAARARGDAEHPPFAGPSNVYHYQAGTLRARKNIHCLTDEELRRFRAVLAKMKSLDNHFLDDRSFAYWARMHATSCQHGWEEFLTWHRAYLYFFEKQLQDIDPSVTLPYWDWAADRENVEKALEDMKSTAPLDNGFVPEAYCCWVDQAALANLRQGGLVSESALQQLEKIQDKFYCSGNRLFIAADIKYGENPASDRAILNQLAATNPLWHEQRWPGGNKDLIFESYPTPEDVERILQLDNFFQFGSGPSDNHFFGAVEQLHNLIHNFSGGDNPNYNASLPAGRDNVPTGDMVNAGVTAFDPIFWAHHSNVDRLWAEWQKLHPNVGPDNPNAVLPPWRTTVAQTYSTHALGYEYAKAVTLFPADNSLPIKRFHSEPKQLHPRVIAGHRKAEIRLHKVQYPARVGYHIRVFLNQPDANEKTATRGNANYVGILHMFSGDCIGGPGHCDVPPDTRPRFDHRGRAHKAPVNFRLDATATVRALAEQGATDFQVNLVVLNTNGSAAHDALILDAVSLNFQD